MGIDVLKKGGDSKGSTPAALQMGSSSGVPKPDISQLLALGKMGKYSAQPSVLGKLDASGATARKVDQEVDFQKILVASHKGGSKTIGSVDIRNAWWLDELRETAKLRTVIFSYDDVTKSSLVTYFGEKRCVEKGLIGSRGVLSIEDIQREGEAWLEENNITMWEFSRPILSKDGEEILYPGFNEQIVETATFVIGETARAAQAYLKSQRPHVLIVDRCSSLHMGIGTAHALNQANKKSGDKVKDYEWGERTSAMQTLKHVFSSLPSHAVVFTGLPGEVKYRIAVDGESMRKRYYDEPTWMKFWNVDCNVQIENTAEEQVTTEGAPIKDGVKTYTSWVRTSQTPLVRAGLEVDITGSGISQVYEERKPKKKE